MKPSVCIFFKVLYFNLLSQQQKSFLKPTTQRLSYTILELDNFIEAENFTLASADLLEESIYRDFPRSGKCFFSSKRKTQLCPAPPPHPRAFYSFGTAGSFPRR
jgi:hypothetical protein